MNGNLPTKPNGPITNWQERKYYDIYSFRCPTGKLLHSVIGIMKKTLYEKTEDGKNQEKVDYRDCHIGLRDGANAYNDVNLYGPIANACHEIRQCQPLPFQWRDEYIFTIKTHEDAKNFLSCISLVNKYSPLGQDTLFAISKLVLGFAKKDNVEVNLLPLFIWLMVMRDENLIPIELRNYICSLFLNSFVEFDEGYSEGFCKNVVIKALNEPKIKDIASYEHPPMPESQPTSKKIGQSSHF